MCGLVKIHLSLESTSGSSLEPISLTHAPTYRRPSSHESQHWLSRVTKVACSLGGTSDSLLSIFSKQGQEETKNLVLLALILITSFSHSWSARACNFSIRFAEINPIPRVNGSTICLGISGYAFSFIIFPIFQPAGTKRGKQVSPVDEVDLFTYNTGSRDVLASNFIENSDRLSKYAMSAYKVRRQHISGPRVIREPVYLVHRRYPLASFGPSGLIIICSSSFLHRHRKWNVQSIG